MVHVQVGTDTYGRVKTVSGTAIVTKFAMLQFLPIFPIQSFYYIGRGPTTRTGVPFLATTQTTAVVGLPLASIDVASVVMAYLRGIFGTLTLVGCLVMVPGIEALCGEHLDNFALSMVRGLLISLAVGLVGGLITYIVPLTSGRDREIRTYCGELFGVSADPARVTLEARQLIEGWLGLDQPALEDHRSHQIHRLIAARLDRANSDNIQGSEDLTDDLLEQIRARDRLPA